MVSTLKVLSRGLAIVVVIIGELHRYLIPIKTLQNALAALLCEPVAQLWVDQEFANSRSESLSIFAVDYDTLSLIHI